MPARFAPFYGHYSTSLAASGLSASTRRNRARQVRAFLRWLDAAGPDAAEALAGPPAWAKAAAAFTTATTSLHAAVLARDALADCARRTGLAPAWRTVPARYRPIHDRYAAVLATTALAPATAASYLFILDAFLRWLDAADHTTGLRGTWPAATAAYLDHLTGNGLAPATILRRQAALANCATALGLPRSHAGGDARSACPGQVFRP